MDSPMASYLAGVYIDHYKVETREGPGGVLIRNNIPETVDASLTTNLELLPDMLSYFSGLFGPYPYTVYGVVIANATIPPCDNPFGGALEAQTQSVHCPTRFMLSEAVLAHELAHQWFGNSVSLERWQDVWLKEGMATYAEWLWITRESGLAGLDELAAPERDHLMIAPIAKPAPDDLYSWQVYTGGALVLHDLRLRLGDEAFFKVLRDYAQRYQYSNAGLEDFIAEAQKSSSTDLQPFFDSWLLDTELPEPSEP
jgi:aminopeptidase N